MAVIGLAGTAGARPSGAEAGFDGAASPGAVVGTGRANGVVHRKDRHGHRRCLGSQRRAVKRQRKQPPAQRSVGTALAKSGKI
ncbi:MAG: hypothetical protein CO105_07995 [Comamonadaceae bacterium CG_4_9_14_3_um_filter_60_33]|nr:MAG: hypothetical protein CO105_07995 [Comamonadaceae bacterium CG_4_9_14_3_um_filter_60_33]